MKKTLSFKLRFTVLRFFLIVLCFHLQSCEKEQEQNSISINLDKQIRLNFPYMSVFTNSTSGVILSPGFSLIDFNKSNYENVDSIVFSASISTDDTTAHCIAELFDLTDNIVIFNSLIETNKHNTVWVESKNIFASLPDKNIDLSIKLRTDKQGSGASIFDALILIYRK